MENRREAIIRETKSYIRETISNYFTWGKNIDKSECYRLALQQLEYQVDRKFNLQGSRKRECIRIELEEEHEEELQQYIEDYILSYRKRMMTQEINATTAGFIISDCLAPENISYFVEMQAYRVKLSILLTDKNKAVFYISYKKLAKDIDKVIPAVRQMQEILKTFGKNTFLDLIRSSDAFVTTIV